MFKKIILLILCTVQLIHAQQFIESMEIQHNTITYRINEKLHNKYLRENLYIEYPYDIQLNQLDYCIITMPLIMNTIAIIWVSNEDYYIDAMDAELYYSLEKVKEVFRRFYPITRFDGNLIPKKLTHTANIWQTKKETPGFALPFSHGLDSLCTSMRHYKTPQLLITARGMPDTPVDMWEINWKYTKKVIKRFAKIYGHTTITITSNFHEFFNWRELCSLSPEIEHWRLCVVEGLGWMGLTAPILISKGYKTFVLPANGDWLSPHPGADCPLINDVVTFAGITCKSDGFEITRAEKNNIIAAICNENNLEKPTFVICENILEERKNCCECYKCVTSILALLLIDEDPFDYGFDFILNDFLDHLRMTLAKNKTYEPDTVRWFKHYQEQAHLKYDKLTPKLQEFFAWFCTINFDAAIEPWNNIVIDYNNFIDIYPNIPDFLKLKN